MPSKSKKREYGVERKIGGRESRVDIKKRQKQWRALRICVLNWTSPNLPARLHRGVHPQTPTSHWRIFFLPSIQKPDRLSVDTACGDGDVHGSTAAPSPNSGSVMADGILWDLVRRGNDA